MFSNYDSFQIINYSAKIVHLWIDNLGRLYRK